MKTFRKPRVLVDVDGVLADFLTAALRIINDVSGKQYVYSDVTDWEIFESLNVSKETEDKCYEIFSAKGFAQSLKPYNGSHNAMKELHYHADVYIVTSPIISETWMYDRTKWLEQEFGISRKKVIHASEKHVVSGDFLIDDRPSNVTNWQEEHPNGEGLLWTQTYNLSAKGKYTRVFGWDETLEKIKSFNK